MNRNFPLFHSHLDLAHQYWEKLLRNGGWAIDATCGNGKDTLALAGILRKKQGGIIGLDLQQEAINKTKELLQLHLSAEDQARVYLYCQSHTHFPLIAQENPIQLIVYNLGYLPKGNKLMTTLTTSTLESVKKAMALIVLGGTISITCYPGHEEGKREENALLGELSHLCPRNWNLCFHTFPNRTIAPSLLLIQKQYQSIEKFKKPTI
jgi:hypothetical protein